MISSFSSLRGLETVVRTIVALSSCLLALPVMATTNCPPAGMAAWWPAEGDGVDIVNGNNATPTGGVAFVSGKVGQSFQLNGTSAYLRVPANPFCNVGQS